MEPKTSKRIVSKGAYAQAQGKRLLLFAGGAGYFVFSSVWLLVTLSLLSSIYLKWPVSWHVINAHPAECLGLLFASIVGAVTFWRWGRDTYHQARQIDPGVPLTRANSANLPAPDILVRPSEESLQAQEAILLRAATGQETPPEQLVRASVEAVPDE